MPILIPLRIIYFKLHGLACHEPGERLTRLTSPGGLNQFRDINSDKPLLYLLILN
jgi:hypothetical protein